MGSHTKRYEVKRSVSEFLKWRALIACPFCKKEAWMDWEDIINNKAKCPVCNAKYNKQGTANNVRN